MNLSATYIYLSLLKTAACLAMWSFNFGDATPFVLQSAFVYAFLMSLNIVIHFILLIHIDKECLLL